MSIHIVKSKAKSLGYMAYEPKYRQVAVFRNGEFVDWSEEIETRSMIATGTTLAEVLNKAIERKLKA